MISGKQLKKRAVEDPHQIGRSRNLRAVKHHLRNATGSEQAMAADAAAKYAYADPEEASQLKDTFEEVLEERQDRVVKQRLRRALDHIDSHTGTGSIGSANQRTAGGSSSDDQTQIYHQQGTTAEQNYCSVCGTELPQSGPTNFCPGCGTELP